jgi:ABC-2 type transport system ATP-binding protein
MGRRDVLMIMERLREKATIFYSTHILDDVQRVSDRVVILNRGRLVAQGPIETLLHADEGTVYRIDVRDDCESTRARILSQPWVQDVHTSQNNGHMSWRVIVTDPQMAEARLLRDVLQEPGIQVLEYGRETYELEDVFMKIVE